VLSELYFEKMNTLRNAQDAYEIALNERDLPVGVLGIDKFRYRGFGPDVLSLGMCRLLEKVYAWAVELKLIDEYGVIAEWVEDAGLTLLREWKANPSLDAQAYCTAVGESRRLPGEQMIRSDPDDLQPRMTTAFPQWETEAEFLAKAQKHYQEMSSWYERRGYVREAGKRQLGKHLRWLAWRAIEGWSYDRIQEAESELHGWEEKAKKSAIHEALAGKNGVARTIGVRIEDRA